MGVEGERGLGGVLDRRRVEKTIVCQFVCCVPVFGEITILVSLIGKGTPTF